MSCAQRWLGHVANIYYCCSIAETMLTLFQHLRKPLLVLNHGLELLAHKSFLGEEGKRYTVPVGASASLCLQINKF
jgi:hypothetical protein